MEEETWKAKTIPKDTVDFKTDPSVKNLLDIISNVLIIGYLFKNKELPMRLQGI